MNIEQSYSIFYTLLSRNHLDSVSYCINTNQSSVLRACFQTLNEDLTVNKTRLPFFVLRLNLDQKFPIVSLPFAFNAENETEHFTQLLEIYVE